MHDEGPSDADLERFGEDAGGYCPECGEEIYDDVEQCPACGMFISGTTSRPPREQAAQRQWVQMVAIVTLIGFLMLAGLGALFRWL